MSQTPYGPPGSGDSSDPQYNPNTGLPESAADHQYGSQPGQYGSDPYEGGQYGAQPGQDSSGQGSYGSEPTAAYGAPQYGSDQSGADPYGSDQQGQYGGDQYSSDQYGASAAAYGSDQYGQQNLAPIDGYGTTAQGESDKSFVVTWLLGWLLGTLGADRFYLGKIGTAIAKLLTAGGLGIWALIDLIMHLVGATRDKEGRRLAGYDRNKKMAWIVTIGVWLLQLVVGIIVTIVLFVSGAATVTTTGPTDPNGGTETEGAADPDGDQDGGDTGDQGTGDSGDTGGQAASGDAVAWAESTYGTFDEVTVDGSGDEVVPVPDEVQAAIVTFESDDEYSRASSVGDDGGSAGGLYLNGGTGSPESGDIGVDDYAETTGIDVMAEGDWSVTFTPVSAAPALPESGSGSGIFLYDGAGGPVDLDYQGESNFIITQLSDTDYAGVVNEIDSYSGSSEMLPGPTIVRVISSGDWTITPA